MQFILGIVLAINFFFRQASTAPGCGPKIVVVTVEEQPTEATAFNPSSSSSESVVIASLGSSTLATSTTSQILLTATVPYQLTPTILSTFIQTTQTPTTLSQTTPTSFSTLIQTTQTPTTPFQLTTTTGSTSVETPNSVTTPQTLSSTSTTSSPPSAQSTPVSVNDARAQCGNNQVISCCNTQDRSGENGGLLGGVLTGVLGGNCQQLPLIGILNLPLNQACGDNEAACCTGDSSGLINIQCNMIDL